MIIGNQQTTQLPVDANGNKTWALIYMPAGYDPSKKYCLMFNFHGKDEIGTTEQDLTALIRTGLTQLLAEGLKPVCFDKNAVLREWIIVSPQAPYWSYGAPQFPYMLAEMQKRVSVDPNYISAVGLSAGGQGAWSCAVDDKIAQQISAVIPLSAAEINTANLVASVKKNNLAVWAICGTNDIYNFDDINAGYIKMLNDAGLPARLTLIQSAGHDAGAWNAAMRFNFDQHPDNRYKEHVWKFLIDNPKNKPMPTTILPTIPCKLEAEDATAMSGVQVETTEDTGGGKDVGYIDPVDMMEYKINAPKPGVFPIDVRYSASLKYATFKTAIMEIRNAAGQTLARVDMPDTGGFQLFKTVSSKITLPAGDQTIRIVAITPGWNLNWIQINDALPANAPAPVPTDPLSDPNFGKDLAALFNRYGVDASLGLEDFNLSGYTVTILKAYSTMIKAQKSLSAITT